MPIHAVLERVTARIAERSAAPRAAYLERLQEHLPVQVPTGEPPEPHFYVVVEKILSGDEELPPTWSVAGTTGYDFLNLVNGLFVDPAGERPESELGGCGEAARNGQRPGAREPLAGHVGERVRERDRNGSARAVPAFVERRIGETEIGGQVDDESRVGGQDVGHHA